MFKLYNREGSKFELLPIINKDGSMGSYSNLNFPFVNNQNSDFLYYNFTFQGLIGNDSFNYQNSITPYKFKGSVFERLVQFDYNKRFKNMDSMEYRVDIYHREIPYIKGKVHPNIDFKLVKMEFITILKGK